jgi:hypothetical protein
MLAFDYKIQPMDVYVKNKNATCENIFKILFASMITRCYNVLNGAIMGRACKICGKSLSRYNTGTACYCHTHNPDDPENIEPPAAICTSRTCYGFEQAYQDYYGFGSNRGR